MRQTAMLAACAALVLGACDVEALGNSNRFREDFKHTYDVKPGGTLTLENFNGSVEIYGWDQDRVEINGQKYASTEDKLREMRIEIAPSADSITVRTIRPSGDRTGSYGARYTIHLPRRTRLDRVQSSNGSIRVEGVEGMARLRTSNGRVRITGLKGDLDATSSNGGMEVADFSGTAVLRTSNGGINVTGVRGHLDAKTSNGGITATVMDLDPSRTLRLNTSNGGITLRLPPTVNAQLRAHTSNASIQSDFTLDPRGSQSKTHMEGAIGGGGPLIELDTSNGSIRVLRN
jgi:DUF4097 and DUF4098 domain-containing protein YvlB